MRPPKPEKLSQELEDEAQYTFEAYCQHYPQELWETLGVEQLLEVPLNEEGDIYVAKMDWIARSPEGLRIIDHKTEERGGLNNTLQRWQYLTQVSLYQWAAVQVYNEPVYGITIDIITRRSPKGQVAPEFSRLDTHRSEAQIQSALGTLRWVASQIKVLRASHGTELWPQNRDNCHKWRMGCEYNLLHGDAGRDEETLRIKYEPAEEYLTGEVVSKL